MHNSDTVRNAVKKLPKYLQQREIKLNRSSEMYQLDGYYYDVEVDSQSPLVDFFVSESQYRVLKDLTPLSRHKFEAV